MDVQQLLARARSMPGRRTVYWPGAGGRDPHSAIAGEAIRPALVWSSLGEAEQRQLAPLAQAAGIDLRDRHAVREACDCSGFACWALGLARRQPAAASWTSADGWINTDSIWRDTQGAQGLFRRLDPGRLRVGALLVYPKPPDHAFGHVGIVTQVSAQGRAERVLHCAADNFEHGGDAVAETGPAAFEAPALRTVGAWYRPLGDAGAGAAPGGR